jgi:glucokinase
VWELAPLWKGSFSKPLVTVWVIPVTLWLIRMGHPVPAVARAAWKQSLQDGPSTEQAEKLALSQPRTLLCETYNRTQRLSPEDVFTAASQGDEGAQEIVGRVSKWLAMGLASFSVILEPEVIVLGGGITAGAGEQLLRPVREHFFRIASPPFVRNVKLISARAGPDAGLLGAAALIFSRDLEA